MFNAFATDIATGLSTCITKDGQTTVTANLPMNSKKFTGLAAGSANGDSLRYEQVVGVYAPLASPTFTGTVTMPNGAFGANGGGVGTSTFDTWGSGFTYFYLNRDSSIASDAAGTTNALLLTQNAYFDGTNWKRIVAAEASNYYQTTGAHNWRVAASSTAGSTISWINALSITSDGRVYGGALHNNAGAVTGTTNQYIASGTATRWTPAPSAVSSCSGPSVNKAYFTRLGNIVTGDLSVSYTATGAGAAFNFTVPIASSLSGSDPVTGWTICVNENTAGHVSYSGVANTVQASLGNTATSGVQTAHVHICYEVT